MSQFWTTNTFSGSGEIWNTSTDRRGENMTQSTFRREYEPVYFFDDNRRINITSERKWREHESHMSLYEIFDIFNEQEKKKDINLMVHNMIKERIK